MKIQVRYFQEQIGATTVRESREWQDVRVFGGVSFG